MQAYHMNQSLHNKYKKANGVYSHISINLAHGLLFALHCDDVRPQNRPSINGSDLSFFKHGGIYFGNNNKFVIGLAFCVVLKSVEVRKGTGCAIINCREQHQSQDAVVTKECLDEYVANKVK